jgi:hypothetical protein
MKNVRLWRSLAEEESFSIVHFFNPPCLKAREQAGKKLWIIEVKTTQFGIQTPFYATSGEVGFSQAREKEYHLYRLFNFVRQPRLFVLQGSLRETCLLNPALYAASPR